MADPSEYTNTLRLTPQTRLGNKAAFVSLHSRKKTAPHAKPLTTKFRISATKQCFREPSGKRCSYAHAGNSRALMHLGVEHDTETQVEFNKSKRWKIT